MKRFSRISAAFLLLPVCYGVSQGLWMLLRPFRQVPEGSFYFLCGLLGYLGFQWAFFRPLRAYVFGHELTHAMAAWLTGGQVKRFHVSKKGGSVTVTKSNTFVALAPYVIPLYSLILLGVFFGANFFYNLRPYWHWILALLGMSLGFHMALTVYALKQDQPDLKTAGKLLSGVLIFLGNSACLVLLLGILFPKTVSWNHFLRVTGRETLVTFQHLGNGLWSLGEKALGKSGESRWRPVSPAERGF